MRRYNKLCSDRSSVWIKTVTPSIYSYSSRHVDYVHDRSWIQRPTVIQTWRAVSYLELEGGLWTTCNLTGIFDENKRVKLDNIILLAKPPSFPTYTFLRHRCCTTSSESELSIHATMRNLLSLRRQSSNIQTTSETWLNVNTNFSAQNESFGFLLFSSLERVNLVWSKA